MLKLNFNEKTDSIYKVLCLGSHGDDIEIGCGGTILRLIENYPNIVVHWIVFSSNSQRELEAYESANRFLKKAKEKNIVIKKFRDGFLPFIGIEIKEFFKNQKYSTHLSNISLLKAIFH